MIVGNGLLAKSFSDFDDDEFLIFVSGVSNSLETNPLAFNREENLLKISLENHPKKKIIYFSTCSIYDSTKISSLYVLHKLKMEAIIKERADRFIIYRVGNVVGKGGNSNTLFNFLCHKIKNNENFRLYKNAKRPLIDVEDISLYFDADKHRSLNQIVDISYPYQYSLAEIVTAIENYYQINSLHTPVWEGEEYTVSFSKEIDHFFKGKDPVHYLAEMVKKYAE